MACGKPPEKATTAKQSGGPTATAGVPAGRLYRNAEADVAAATRASTAARTPDDVEGAQRAVAQAQSALDKAKAAGVAPDKRTTLAAALDAARRHARAMAKTARTDQAAVEDAQYRALARAIVGQARPTGGARPVAPRAEDIAAAKADMKALADARKQRHAEDGDRNDQVAAKIAHQGSGQVRSSSRGKVQVDLAGLLEHEGSLTYGEEERRWNETNEAGLRGSGTLHSHIPTEYRPTPMWGVDIGKPMGVLTVPRDPAARALLWPMWTDEQHNEVPPGRGEGPRG